DLLIQELLSLPCLEPSDRVDVRTTFRNLKESSVTLSFERMATSSVTLSFDLTRSFGVQFLSYEGINPTAC
ncbi:MAG: hypothetical protein KBD67_06775, partial [Anaerolineaceae bacterium]|nr:hypothetical protein [Anaerolineaceae bacterium]